jgi:MoxR-like ATPase
MPPSAKVLAHFEALHALIGQRVPLHIWGACGVGKSQIVAQVASDLNWQFLDVCAVQLDPVDLRGLPRIAADQAEWVPPKFLPTSGQGILFSRRADCRTADDTGRLLSAGARSQAR